MRTQRNKRNAARPGKDGGVSRGIIKGADALRYTPIAPLPQAILTAIPIGKAWCVKAIDSTGEVTLLGKFDGRLPALGAAVLLAAKVGAEVVP